MKKRYLFVVLIVLTLMVGCQPNEVVNEELEEEEEEFQIDEEMETKVRGMNLAESIIRENFTDVRLEDFIINTEIEDVNVINNADFYLYLDNKNEDEVEKIIDEYGEIFSEKFGEKESFLGITLYWMTPNQDRENAIERDYVQ